MELWIAESLNGVLNRLHYWMKYWMVELMEGMVWLTSSTFTTTTSYYTELMGGMMLNLLHLHNHHL